MVENERKETNMGLLKNDTFVCVDCETTGLDTENDHIIEVGIAIFTFNEILETYETLITPPVPISEESIAIHGISDSMVKGKPTIKEVLPKVLKMISNYPIVGHGIEFDINIIANAANREKIQNKIRGNRFIDTLRLARLYGECPKNSLENLRKHFNIEEQGAHRAMNDVTVNISVFKQLTTQFKTSEQIFTRLEKPVELKTMPLGKHKGRPLKEIPVDYLKWALYKDFDLDLKFSLKTELKRRGKKGDFLSSSNPFHDL